MPTPRPTPTSEGTHEESDSFDTSADVLLESSSDFDDQDLFVANVRRRFRRRHVSGASRGREQQATKKGRKKLTEWRTKLFLLRKAEAQKAPTPAVQTRLSINGLGKPAHERPGLSSPGKKSVLKRYWSIQQLDSFVQQSYPDIPLGDIGFRYGCGTKGRKIRNINRQDITTVDDVEALVGQGIMYIMPNEDIQQLEGERRSQPVIENRPTVAQVGEDNRVGERRLQPQPEESEEDVHGHPLSDVEEPMLQVSQPTVAFDNQAEINLSEAHVPLIADGSRTPTHHAQDLEVPHPTVNLDHHLQGIEELEVSSDDNMMPDFFIASGTPTVSLNPPGEMINEIKQDVADAFNALSQCLTEEIAKISIRRDHVLEDVLKAYSEDNQLGIKRLDVEFKEEAGADFGGLTRDMLSMFWTEAISVYFSGEGTVVPRIPLHKQRALRGDYATLGSILGHTVALIQTIPPRLSRTFLSLLIFEDAPAEEYLLRDFLEFVTSSERSLIKQAISDFSGLTESKKDNLISLFSMYGLYDMPKPQEITQQILSIAEAELVDKSRPFVASMRRGIPQLQMELFWRQLSLESINFIVCSQLPSGRKVAEFIVSDSDDLRAQEETVLWWLRDFVMSLDAEDVANFLRFTTGSSVMPQEKIKVAFLPSARFPVARTCGNLIQSPVFYSSKNELKREWRAILGNPESFSMSLV